ncbi:MAG: DUF1592 domain-containing protein [Verrucomicrobiales bacterium]|nr:DUF1592 domain-containing protein [Verrucomicrobiales bacterium]
MPEKFLCKSFVPPAAVVLAGICLGISGILRSESAFEEKVVPLLEKYCYECHDDLTTKGNLDLTPFLDPDSVVKERKLWLRVLHQIESKEMPPEKPFPASDELATLVEEIDHAVNDVDWSSFRNPGHVPLARLSQLQYRNSIRDLLGIDFKAGLSLPRDPEGPSGFRNDRSSLLINGSYLEKYYNEAQRALDALFFLKANPSPGTRRIGANEIKVFRARIAQEQDTPVLVLPTPSATGSSVVVLPETGYYRVTIHAGTKPYPVTGLNLYADGNEIGSVIVEDPEMRDYTMTVLMEKGSNLISLRTDVAALPLRNDYRVEFPVPRKYIVEATKIAEVTAPKLKPFSHYSKAAREQLEIANRASFEIFEYYQLLKLLREHDAVSDDTKVRGEWLGRRTRYKRANMELASLLKIPDGEVFARWEKETISPSFDEYMDFGNAYVEESRLKYFYKRPFSGEVAVSEITFDGPVEPGAIELEGLYFDLPGSNVAPLDDAEVRTMIRDFASRAFRRPVDEAQLDELFGFYSTARGEGADFYPALKDVLAVALCSPEFLYRFDALDGPGKEIRLSSHQLAGRLASFLWASVPDGALLVAADADFLISDSGIAEQTDRMRQSPKVRAFSESFVSEWLDFANLGGNIMPNIGRYPGFSRALAEDMKKETSRFFEHILRDDRSLLELLESDYLLLNERMANYYGHPAPREGSEFAVYEKHVDHLGGLLGMAGLMTVTSTPTRTSPVKRGVWMLEKIFGEHLPPPPPNVPELPPGTGERAGISLREELARHREQKECAGCHDKIDNFGFVLENFDPIGKWRISTPEVPVDSTVTLKNGKTYENVVDFKAYLLEERRDDFLRNLTEQMLSYALGRPLEYFDTPVVDKIADRVREEGYRPSVLLQEIARSYPFNYQSNLPVE